MFLRRKKGYKTQVHSPEPPPPAPELRAVGPGTKLRRLFKWLGFRPCSGCTNLAVQMDQNGNEWCRDHFDYIVAQVCGRAERQGYPADTWRPWIERVVKIAIR